MGKELCLAVASQFKLNCNLVPATGRHVHMHGPSLGLGWSLLDNCTGLGDPVVVTLAEGACTNSAGIVDIFAA